LKKWAQKQHSRLTVILSLATLLNGCTTTPKEPTIADQNPIAAPSKSVGIASRKFLNTGNLTHLIPQKAPPLPTLKTLGSLDSMGLQELFGAPSFTRHDEPAQLWQYRGNRCTLDIFLYRPTTSSNFQVAHFAARPSGSDTISTEVCFHSVLARGGKTG